MSSTTNTSKVSEQKLGAAKPAGQTVDQAKNSAGVIVDKRPPKSTKTSAPKSSKMLDLLNRKSGCTLDELQNASGWQAHSVRGFLSGIVKKKLGVMEFSNSAAWLDAFAAIEALEPLHIVPGHGALTTLETAQADTRDYLINLRQRMREHIDAGGDIIESVDVDQSTFSYLDQFEALAKRNAQTVFQQMEWE